ncbi:hypothetical protein MKK58_00665 [Methylobacterium sp. J-078]|uniref:hypothetical protein n=1 Tax=Methylobacterium sp. J-078 TaxID=2836657 RepID=UPI001FBBB3EB|nr:hypothetical protein [Methylobacterium sp. J-078]MCJ2043068.1 hypothetical protein [Methylobacterium sp. J-078]
MSARTLDRDRFAKCRALMDRGATDGERAAGKAAATRVAAAAGLSLAAAIGIVDADQARTTPGPSPHAGSARRPHGRPTYAWAQPKPKTEPITVEELLRQKEADLARKKKAAYRSEPRQEENADFERWAAEAREAQFQQDREWAERRQREEAQS